MTHPSPKLTSRQPSEFLPDPVCTVKVLYRQLEKVLSLRHNKPAILKQVDDRKPVTEALLSNSNDK